MTLLMNISQPDITGRHYDIIAGTILGGSSVMKPARGKNSYLAMRSKHNLWLEYKAQELGDLASDTPFTIEKTLRWHSLCYPIFNRFREMFYQNGKRNLTLEPLDALHDVGLAIWYGDCGSYRKGKVTLRTHLWGKRGTQVIAEYFARLDWPGTITQEKKCYRFVIEGDSAKKYLERVLPQLPSFMS